MLTNKVVTVKKILILAIVALSGCATAPSFVVTDSPQSTYTFEVQTETDDNAFNGVYVPVWIEAKAANISRSKGCTHFRELSSGSSRVYNYWVGKNTFNRAIIYECVNINDHKYVITSKDTITINDGKNTGNSSRSYKDINPVLFQHRELISKINQNEN